MAPEGGTGPDCLRRLGGFPGRRAIDGDARRGEGAEFARSVGLAAEPRAVPDEVDVADTLIGIARERGAAVVVVGSQHCDRPVLVIRDDSP